MLAHPKYKVFEKFLLWVRNISGTYFFSLLVIFGEEQLWYVDYFLSYSFIFEGRNSSEISLKDWHNFGGATVKKTTQHEELDYQKNGLTLPEELVF